jgi:hypothetical protein
MLVPVLRNPGTHNNLPQHERKNMYKHSSVFKNVQKRFVKWVAAPRSLGTSVSNENQSKMYLYAVFL